MFITRTLLACVLVCHVRLTLATSECDQRPPQAGACSQLCLGATADQSPRCACVPGYTLDTDGRRCLADDWLLPGVLLVYNHGPNLKAFNLSLVSQNEHRVGSLSSTAVYRARSRVDAIDVSIARTRVYFALRTDIGSELRSVYLGSAPIGIENNVDDEIINGLGEVNSIAVDWVGENVYIADTGLGSLIACSLRTRSCVVVRDSISWLGPVAVDSTNGKLYWNDCQGHGGLGTLETSRLDGQGRRTLLRGVGCVMSLTIDLPVQTIYWVHTSGIGYCHLSNCTKILNFPVSMKFYATTSFEDDLIFATDSYDSDYGSDYGSNYGSNTIMLMMANKFSPSPENAVSIEDHLVEQPTVLRVMHGGLQVHSTDVCVSLNCSHVCLLTSATTARCACPAGKKLNVDGRSCSVDWQLESILVVSGTDILLVSTDHVGGVVDDVIYSAPAGDDVTAMAYNSESGMLYVGMTRDEPARDYIARIDLQRQPPSRSQVLFDNVANITDMDIDGVNVYWIANGKLMVGRQDGAVWKTMVDAAEDAMQLSSLAVDSRNQRLLYAECGKVGSTVKACNLSAGNCAILLDRTRCVHDLYFDSDANTLYWIEANIIMSLHAVDTRPEFVKVSSEPRAVVTTTEHIAWSDDHEAAVYLMAKGRSPQLRAMKTGRQHLSAMTIVGPSSASQHPRSSCNENNGGCPELCIDGEVGATSEYQCICASSDTCNQLTQPGMTLSAAETGEGRVTSHVIDSNDRGCRQLECLNGGVCVVDDRQMETCQCPVKYGGRRCKRPVTLNASERPSDESDDEKSSSSIGLHIYVVAVVAALLVIVAGGIAACCARRRRRRGSSIVSGDELNMKTDRNYRKYESKSSELNESSLSDKPFALPRPSLVTGGNATKSRDNPTYIH